MLTTPSHPSHLVGSARLNRATPIQITLVERDARSADWKLQIASLRHVGV